MLLSSLYYLDVYGSNLNRLFSRTFKLYGSVPRKEIRNKTINITNFEFRARLHTGKNLAKPVGIKEQNFLFIYKKNNFTQFLLKIS